jgi:ABC-type dipeptide/oligopeptide/nickel transport system permease component
VQGVAPYILRRLMLAPLILFVISIATFALGRLAPGDYVDIVSQGRARPDTVERIREEMGLNDPIPVQYVRWLGNALQGDLGTSVTYQGAPVEDVIFPRLWVTLQYNLVVMVLTFAIGIPLGTWAALRRGTWLDPFAIGTFLLFASVPVVVTIPILQWLFAVRLGVLPTTGWNATEVLGMEVGIFSPHIILAVLILTLPGVAGVARYMRSQVIEVMDHDFVRTARAKGLQERVVVVRHLIRNAMLPVATIMGFEIAALFSGSIFVETLLAIPGIGSYAFEAIGNRDHDSIMAIVLLGSAVFIIANLLVDIAYGFIDPRIRVSEAAAR